MPSRLLCPAVPLKIRDGLALVIDVPLPALNSAFSFLDVSLQDGLLHRTPYGHRWKAGHFLLDRTSDRSPFLLVAHDSRNGHRVETEAGLRLMDGPPSVTAIKLRGLARVALFPFERFGLAEARNPAPFRGNREDSPALSL